MITFGGRALDNATTFQLAKQDDTEYRSVRLNIGSDGAIRMDATTWGQMSSASGIMKTTSVWSKCPHARLNLKFPGVYLLSHTVHMGDVFYVGMSNSTGGV